MIGEVPGYTLLRAECKEENCWCRVLLNSKTFTRYQSSCFSIPNSFAVLSKYFRCTEVLTLIDENLLGLQTFAITGELSTQNKGSTSSTSFPFSFQGLKSFHENVFNLQKIPFCTTENIHVYLFVWHEHKNPLLDAHLHVLEL